MSQAFELIFEIQDFWHISNGQEGGAYADALVLKDTDDLPFVPGKSVKGLLRHAFNTALEHSWFTNIPEGLDIMLALFGGEHREGIVGQGMLQVASAELPFDDKQALNQQNIHKSHLYRVLNSTAIDSQTGVAIKGSLRAIEVVVPMVLVSDINLNPNHPYLVSYPEIEQQFPQWLSACLPLITHIGGKRQRGLGPVFVSCEAINTAEEVA
jgi:CRISPR/Cas system CSM-associated protein Csm3 (group 7 of RAMP superfamily)